MKLDQSRRDLLLTSLLLAFPLNVSSASASPLNPAQTIITLPDKLGWTSNPNFPAHSVEMCPLFGDINGEGLYYSAHPLVARFHERSARLRDRPALRRRLGDMVVQQRGGL
jgi:hypothetical protein